MSARILCLPVLLAFLALPVFGQSADEIYCANRNARLPADQVMAACNRMAADARQRDSARARAYAWRGVAHNRAADRTAALADFNQALALDDDNYTALIGRSQAHYISGDYAAALADINRAAALEPDNDSIYVLRSNINLRLHRYAEAIADADGIRRAGGAGILNQRCRARAVAGIELDKAMTACNQALWTQPDAPALRNTRGLLSLQQKRFDLAWRDFNAAALAAPRNARALYGRGLAALGLRREAEGKADMAAAAAIAADIAADYEADGVTPQNLTP